MNKRDRVYQKLKESKKYKYLCDDTLYRITDWAVERYDPKRAVKAAQKKLHQVYGAFFEKINLNKIENLLATIPANPDSDSLKRVALEIKRFHASTSERIPILEKFYHDLFSRIGKPKKVLDLACGLNPFSIQWMGLEPGAEYYCVDIDKRLTSMINTFFKYLNRPFKAKCADILVSMPTSTYEYKADMIFILKTLPSLEQQEKGASEKLLKSLKAKHIVISYPAKSLTGKEKGMGKYYQNVILELIKRLSLNYFKLEYPTEIFYIVEV